MFKKALAAMGIGNAQVDLVVLSEQMAPGYPVQLEVNIKGGDVPQDIGSLYLKLMTAAEYEEEVADIEYEGVLAKMIENWEIEVNRTILAGETVSYEFEIVLHPETPVTAIDDVRNYSRVWFETTLEIENGLDAKDRDYLDILPTPTQAAVLSAMLNSGFYLKKIDVEAGVLDHPEVSSSVEFYQEFEFGLQGGGVFGIQEVEVSFINTEYYLGVVLEIDRSLSGDTYRSMLIASDVDDENNVLPTLRSVLSS